MTPRRLPARQGTSTVRIFVRHLPPILDDPDVPRAVRLVLGDVTQTMRLFRIAVPTSNIDRGRAFYEQVLDTKADDTVPTRLYFHLEGAILALVDWSVEGRGGFTPNPEHLYFGVHELEQVQERTMMAGARITSPIGVRDWGERSFYCLDPDGNGLCFVDDETLFLGEGAAWS